MKLIKGKDWHAWAWKKSSGKLMPETWTSKPKGLFPWGNGEWVKVRLIEVKDEEIPSHT